MEKEEAEGVEEEDVKDQKSSAAYEGPTQSFHAAWVGRIWTFRICATLSVITMRVLPHIVCGGDRWEASSARFAQADQGPAATVTTVAIGLCFLILGLPWRILLRHTSLRWLFHVLALTGAHIMWVRVSVVQSTDLDPRILGLLAAGMATILQAMFQADWRCSSIAFTMHILALMWLSTVTCMVILPWLVIINYVIYCNDPQRRHEERQAHEREKYVRCEVEAKNRALREIEEQRRTLYRNVLHDLKQPMQMVDAALQLQRKGEAMTDHLDRIMSIFRLLLDNLEVSKQLDSTSKLPMQRESVNLHRVIDETVLTMRTAHPHLIVTSSIAASCAARRMLVDKHVLCRALWNVTGNAAKYTPRGGLIDIAASLDEHSVPQTMCVQVCDTGAGIPTDKVNALFGEFAQLDQGIVGGQGLGLYTSRLSLRSIGGDITYAPNTPTGASFTLRFPFEDDPGIDAPAVGAPPGASPRPPTPASTAVEVVVEEPSHRHVLIVDDNDMLRWLHAELVRKLGYRVSTACDGQEALQHLRRKSPTAFDAMITDLNMPTSEDGLELLRACRRDVHLFNLPIAVLSGSSSTIEGVDREVHALGALLFAKGSHKNVIAHILQRIF